MKNFRFLFPVIFGLAIFATACNPKASQAENDNQKNDSTAVNLPYPDWVKNAVIYEVNVRQYTPEGTFKAFDQRLPALKELDVDILWFMPIYPIGEKERKGTLGSYYSIKDYKAVNPEFGTAEDFKTTVQKAHDTGFKVILDWVANHTSRDHAWVTEHSDWYKKDSLDKIIAPFDWTDVAQLDYENKDMRAAMIDAMKYWVSEFDIDGFRCDVAGMVPVDFWEDARMQLDAVKPVFMLAEDEEKGELCNKAFDANYGWGMHHLMSEVYKGKKNASDIAIMQQNIDSVFSKDAMKMNFVTNHDENSWNGTVTEKFGKGEKAFAVLTYTLPGMPLIYSGQEANIQNRLKFFEKDPIVWSDTTLIGFYKNLNAIKHKNEALFNPPYGGKFIVMANSSPNQVLSFLRKTERETILVMTNLSSKPAQVEINNESAFGDYANVTSSVASDNIKIEKNGKVSLEPWGYYVLRLR